MVPLSCARYKNVHDGHCQYYRKWKIKTHFLGIILQSTAIKLIHSPLNLHAKFYRTGSHLENHVHGHILYL